jgi:hypothetical protein
MDKSKRNRLIKIIGITIFFLSIGIIVLNDFIKHKKLEKDHLYTIGKVYDYHVLSQSGSDIYYEFYVDSARFEGTASVYDNPKNYLNKKYQIKYNPKNPDNSEILLNIQVRE